MKKLLAIFLACSLLGACASVIHPNKQNVTIRSNPSGATLRLDGRSYTTPAVVPLKGKSEYYFTVEKPGYKTTSGKIDSDFRVWSTVLGNIANLTGLIGIGVDVLGTGAAYELEKDNTITLEPYPVAAVPAAPAAMPSDGAMQAVPPAGANTYIPVK